MNDYLAADLLPKKRSTTMIRHGQIRTLISLHCPRDAIFACILRRDEFAQLNTGGVLLAPMRLL